MARTLKPSATLTTVLETDVLDYVEGEDDAYPTIRAAWNGRGLVITQDNAASLKRELNELSNECDAMGESGDIKDADERSLYRRAARGFATLMLAVGDKTGRRRHRRE